MSMRIVVSLLAATLCIGLGSGCSDDDDSGPSGSSDSYAGTWKGNVCGRSLTMNMSQNGTSLSGNYHLSDPVFSENFSGTVSSETPPASATLNGGGDRSFKINFESHNSFHGGFYKGGSKVCDTGATK